MTIKLISANNIPATAAQRNKNIKRKIFTRLFGSLAAFVLIIISCGNINAQEKPQLVRLAKLQIDSAQLDQYKAELAVEIETSLRLERGVITLYAVAEKDNPTNITILEIYANQDAYWNHLQTVHFKKYKANTAKMIRTLELVEVTPIVPAVKVKG